MWAGKAWVTSLFSDLKRWAAKEIDDLDLSVAGLQNRIETLEKSLSLNPKTKKPKKVAKIAKAVALKNLEDFESAFKDFSSRIPQGQQLGVVVEFYEKNVPEMKYQRYEGVQNIQAFIDRAKKDEVRIVKMVQ